MIVQWYSVEQVFKIKEAVINRLSGPKVINAHLHVNINAIKMLE
jgi:hypothetical protein